MSFESSASHTRAEPHAAAWRKLVGTALLWAGLAALVHVPQADASASTTLIAVLGFVSFAAGLSLFADGLKRSIVAELGGR